MSDSTPALAAGRALPAPLSMAMCVHSAPGVYALLLGSGVSTAAGIRTGWGIMGDLAQQAAHLLGHEDAQTALALNDPGAWWGQHFPDHGDLTYSKILAEAGPEAGARLELLKGYFAGKQPTAAHHAIARLVQRGYVRVILTTNFDTLIEDALHAAGVPFQVVTSAQASSMQPLAHNGTATVLKLHGDYRELEMRNTSDELARYGGAWRRQICEVFRDFGLIVCGWSADWDRALVRCLSRRKNGRYPVFWSSFRSPGKPAAELIAQLRAVPIDDTSADDLFTELAENASALERIADLPPSPAMAVSRLKRYLPDFTRRIALHDLLDQHTDQAIARLQDPDQHPLALTSQAGYVEQLDLYRDDTLTLLRLLATGVFHDRDAEHHHLWVRVLQRLVDARNRYHDNREDKAQHYPALLALHTAGCAAVLNRREDLLVRLLIEVTWASPGYADPRPVAAAVRSFDVLHDASWLPAPAANGTANPSKQSSRLRTDLLEVLGEASAHSVRAFNDAFDRLEYLILLVELHLTNKAHRWSTFLAPHTFADETLEAHDRVASLVAKDIAPGWPMLTAGAFDGDAAKASAAAQRLRTLLTGSGS